MWCTGSVGLWALERRLSSCGTRAYLLRGMWDLPRPGLEPGTPSLAGGFSTTETQGEPEVRSILITTLLPSLCSWSILQVSSRGASPLAQWFPGSLPKAGLTMGSTWGLPSPITVTMSFYWIPLLSHCKRWFLPSRLNNNLKKIIMDKVIQ